MNNDGQGSPNRDDILCTVMYGGWVVTMIYVPEIARFFAAILK